MIGFIGLGNMGFPMAQNILKKGFALTVYNRTKEKALPLIQQGAKWCNSAQELASQCDILVTMVANDQALSTIVDGILSANKRPRIHISMSTISPGLASQLEGKHREKGILFLAAPVTGRPERAKLGALWIFLAGDEQGKKVAQPVLQTMGVKIFDLGPKPSQAALFKLCNNFMILSFIESFAEASTMLEKEGVSPEKAAEVWGNSLFDSPLFHSYEKMLCQRNFSDGGFALDLGLKDMRLLHTCADGAQVPMPLLSELHAKLITSMNLGREKFDWSGIALLSREAAGLKP